MTAAVALLICRSVSALGLVAVAMLAVFPPQGGPTAAAERSESYGWAPEYATAFPGCHEAAEGALSPLLVVRFDGTVQRMAFDAAWERTHNDTEADDVWVIGACK